MADKWYPGHGYPPHHGGHPPPHPGGYPPQPSYAYVPAVMMPPYQQQPPPPAPDPVQPTYVTNYIYQQPADPVQVVDHASPVRQPLTGAIDWVPCTVHTAQHLSPHAVVAGHEAFGNGPLWVIRAHHNGDLIPGKLCIQQMQAYVPFGGKEMPVHNFEVLCAPGHLIRWMSSRNGQVPTGAIAAGNTSSGETLYVGRAHYSNSLTPGKVHPSHGSMYIPYGGQEVPHKQYEVLCKASNLNLSFNLNFGRR